MKIYMAGSLFSTSECDFNSNLAGLLRAHGHEVFLPQENEQGEDPMKIFKSDVSGIERADLVLANLDGPDPDSGTCWEVGYGYARGKFIGCYRTDFRVHKGFDPINLMMTADADFLLLAPKMPVFDLADALHDKIRVLKPSKLTRAQALREEAQGFDRAPLVGDGPGAFR